ncbi:MAG: phosphonate C-P lyase system protein PhnH [Cyanobacteria bacterium P01_F01_bin.53]
MLTTQLPGFEEITRDSQQTFRALLEALSGPGQPHEITVVLTPPEGLTLPCAATCLTLLDLETMVWLQPGFPEEVQGWLRFHTGCRFAMTPAEAAFAVVHTLAEIALDELCWGSAESPEASTTLLAQVSALSGADEVVLTGPGILASQTISPAVPMRFWHEWHRNHTAYPRGMDVFLFDDQAVMGLPRTSHAQIGDGRISDSRIGA